MKKALTLIAILCLLPFNVAMAEKEDCSNCCDRMGGIHYCDSSAGRYVCKNGYFSSCYCTRRAIMDLQVINGCCIWKGGVWRTRANKVYCKDGSVSEICSYTPAKSSFVTYGN